MIAEVVARLRDAHPEWPGGRMTALMDGLRDSLDIVDEYDPSIPFHGSDEGDRHVHAAAVAAEASFLITDDRGFTRLSSDDTPYEAITADDFLVLVDDSLPELVGGATPAQLRYWGEQGARADLVEHLITARCPAFADRVALHIEVQAQALSRTERRRALGRPRPR